MFREKVQRIALLAVGGFALLFLAAAGPARAADHQGGPVLMVIANQDFWAGEHRATRAALEAHGLEVVVAAATPPPPPPPAQGDTGVVVPDIALSDVDADDYSAIVFSGGWGMAQYQYDFPGTYDEPDYRPDARLTRWVNLLIDDFLRSGKPTTAICHGVTVLAWARVDGASPLRGRTVAAYAGGVPGFKLGGEKFPDAEVPVRWHLEVNGATVLTAGSVGDPLSSSDDVVVDGNIITAENYDSASRFAETIAQGVLASAN